MKVVEVAAVAGGREGADPRKVSVAAGALHSPPVRGCAASTYSLPAEVSAGEAFPGTSLILAWTPAERGSVPAGGQHP